MATGTRPTRKPGRINPPSGLPSSRPNWDTYQNLLEFAAIVRKDVADLKPRDNIDIQSFLWVQGSDEYEE